MLNLLNSFTYLISITFSKSFRAQKTLPEFEVRKYMLEKENDEKKSDFKNAIFLSNWKDEQKQSRSKLRRRNLRYRFLVVLTSGEDRVLGAEYVIEGGALGYSEELESVLHGHLERRRVVGSGAGMDQSAPVGNNSHGIHASAWPRFVLCETYGVKWAEPTGWGPVVG